LPASRDTRPGPDRLHVHRGRQHIVRRRDQPAGATRGSGLRPIGATAPGRRHRADEIHRGAPDRIAAEAVRRPHREGPDRRGVPSSMARPSGAIVPGRDSLKVRVFLVVTWVRVDLLSEGLADEYRSRRSSPRRGAAPGTAP
jgi:hypothetical protein